MKHRLHVVGLPHTASTKKEFLHCGYTQKMRSFCQMMHEAGHTVFHYGGEGSDVPCTEHVTLLTKAERNRYFHSSWEAGEFPDMEFNANRPYWMLMNARAIRAIYDRIQPLDVLCMITGLSQAPITNSFPNNPSIEYGVGYEGVTARFRCFESQAWRHHVYGLRNERNGLWYDTVIGNYYDPTDFPLGERKGDYYLFLGRLILRKNPHVAADVCKRIEAKLIIAGQGVTVREPGIIRSRELGVFGDHVEHIGVADVEKRAELLGNAKALFVLTQYLAPFEGVHAEANLCGCPVITTDWGVFPETVVNGLNGYRIRTIGEAMWAARNVHRLDPNAIREYALKKFTLAVNAPKYEEWIDRIVNIYRGPGKSWYDESPGYLGEQFGEVERRLEDLEMTILLVNPPFFRFLGLEQDYVPLSLMAVGAKIGGKTLIKNMEIGPGLTYQGYAERASGFERYLAGVADTHNAIWNELRDTIEKHKPNAIGVTVLNVKFRSFQVIYKIAKEYGIQVFAGGPHTLIEPGAYPLDVALFSGEYEAGSGDRIRNLDTLPFPEYTSLLDHYSSNAYAHLMTSRGCPFNCRFCSSSLLWKRKVTYSSADRILDEMRYIESYSGADQFTIWDEVFTLHKARLREFCAKYDLAAKWRCDTRADILDNDTVRMMRDAGCSQMSLGVESGVDSILHYIGKGETTEDYRRAADILNQNGMQWKAYCIIGFPEESAEDMRKTIAFVKSLQPFRITLSYFTPYKGTPLFGECVERGLLSADTSLNDFFHQGSCNYFCPKLTKQEYTDLKHSLSCEVDEYNKEALSTWR